VPFCGIPSLPQIVRNPAGTGPPIKISIKKDRFFIQLGQKADWHTGCLGDHRHIALCAAHKGTKAGGASN
jgi:hypothetical protein